MMEKNNSIVCSVKECSYHANTTDCTLDKVQIGKHEQLATQPECTDCESFRAKN